MKTRSPESWRSLKTSSQIIATKSSSNFLLKRGQKSLVLKQSKEVKGKFFHDALYTNKKNQLQRPHITEGELTVNFRLNCNSSITKLEEMLEADYLIECYSHKNLISLIYELIKSRWREIPVFQKHFSSRIIITFGAHPAVFFTLWNDISIKSIPDKFHWWVAKWQWG